MCKREVFTLFLVGRSGPWFYQCVPEQELRGQAGE